MATIHDVAKRARVSTATVSAVVNSSAYVSPELTRRVRAAVSALNYTPNAVAHGLQTQRSNTIGMLVPDIAEPVYAEITKGVERTLGEAGYSLLLASTHNDAEEQSKHLNLLRSGRVDGLLVFLAFDGEDDFRDIVAAGRPVVFIAREPSGFEADAIVVDNTAAARAAVEKLIQGGHRRVGLIIGPRRLKVNQDRFLGWREALEQAGAPHEDCCLVEGDYTAASGEAAAEKLLTLEEPPTAIFAAGFLMMTGCVAYLKRRGLRAPDDVELMSWSDSPLLDVFDPPISSVRQPSVEMGMRAAELMLSRLRDGRKQALRIVLPAEIKMRR